MDSTAPPDYLLRTKLYRPRIAQELVPRPHLLERLQQGDACRLALIAAPAGYGKTTLVDAWLNEAERPYAWLSLDRQDNDFTSFALYLAAAIRSRYPTAVPATWALVTTSGLPPATRLADILLQEITTLDQPLWLIIDDYHIVNKQDIHELMARFVMNAPLNLRIVLISRSDPPFPLARLRARGQLIEIRATDLRFDRREAGLLLRNTLHTAVPDEVTTLLEERTEGWPVGLQLAAISLRDSDSPAAFAQRFAASSHRLVSDYLVDEVLATLSDKQRRELLVSSLPDRFCAPLFAALTGAPELDAPDQRYLDSLWRANLFVVALDEGGIWYRYHTLFRMFLRQRLSQSVPPAEIAGLHAQASAWFAGQGLLEEAIKHALLSNDHAAALGLFEKHLADALNKDDWRRLERWLSHFPPQEQEPPALSIARAYLLHYSFQHVAMAPFLHAAQQALAANPYDDGRQQIYLGLINILRAIYYRNVDDDSTAVLEHAAAARRQLPDTLAATRSLAESATIFTLHSMGRGDEALQTAQELLQRQPLRADTRSLRLLLAINGFHFGEADLPALSRTLPLFHRLAEEAGQALSLCWSFYGLGWMYYQRNELQAAEHNFNEALAFRYGAHGRAVIDVYTGLALARLAQGHLSEATAVVSDLRTFLNDRGLIGRLALADALALRLAQARGDFNPAWHSLAGYTRAIPAQIAAGMWETPVLTAARAYIAAGDAASLRSAGELLAAARAVAEARYATRQLIEINALLALQQAACGHDDTALVALTTAVRLGEPGQTLRLIADAGPGLQPLLRHLLARGIAPDYLRRILDIMPAAGASAQLPVLPLLPAARQMSAALTNREIDVLLLLAQRLTNKEIGTQLSLSPNTVKKHAINLYAKLEVSNRRQAVARARDLGLLPEGL